MELKESLVFCFILTMIIIESSTGAPPPPQSPPPPSGSFTCLAELMICQGGSTPSTACCTTLKRVYETEKACLCFIVMTENATSQLGMNGTQVSDLLVKCDIVNATTTTTFCNASSPFPAPNLPFTPGSPFQFLSPPGSVFQAPPPPSEDSAMYNKATWVWWPGLPCFLLFIFLGWI